MRPRLRYPWAARYEGALSPITPAHFACKGSELNPPIFLNREETLFDCNGVEGHTLPIVGGHEHVPQELIDVLNYIQTHFEKRVHITAGHRCPKHQRYVNPSYKAQFSKHLIGAEVTFYVEGMENSPHAVIEAIETYYTKHPSFKSDPRYTIFERYHKSDTDVSTPPWYNRELFIKLYSKHEGRDFDNDHNYPYISIQVRFDRSGKRVRYSHEVALHSIQFR